MSDILLTISIKIQQSKALKPFPIVNHLLLPELPQKEIYIHCLVTWFLWQKFWNCGERHVNKVNLFVCQKSRENSKEPVKLVSLQIGKEAQVWKIQKKIPWEIIQTHSF